jgi:hypothetical protein
MQLCRKDTIDVRALGVEPRAYLKDMLNLNLPQSHFTPILAAPCLAYQRMVSQVPGIDFFFRSTLPSLKSTRMRLGPLDQILM